MRARRKKAILVVRVVGALALCGTSAAFALQADAMEVELDAFSGRPNPVWHLPEAVADDVLTRLQALGPGSPGGGEADGLGYRGFVLRPDNGALAGYDEVRVVRGRIVTRRGDTVLTFSDDGRALEQMLLQSAGSHVPAAVLDHLRGEIGH